jgi:transcriptional regulator with XRE-family HTH domain
MNNILSVTFVTPQEIALQIAQRVRARRLEMNLTQEGVAYRSGLSLSTYRRFERTGEISLKGLLWIGFAMNMLPDFDGLFAQRQYQSIDEVLAERTVNRKRGKKNE